MIVECPSCATRFNLDESRIGERGAKVRCSVCSHSFVVHAHHPLGDESTDVDAAIEIDGLGTDTNILGDLDPGAAAGSTSTRPGGIALNDNALTTPGASAVESVSPNEIIEIDASEVSELDDESPGGFTAPRPDMSGRRATLPGIAGLQSPGPLLDIEEPSGPADLGFEPAEPDSESLTGFTDPFAPPEPDPGVATATELLDSPIASTFPGTLAPGVAAATDFEGHATAVYDVGRLAQSPEALGQATADLERDVPGGLGPLTGGLGASNLFPKASFVPPSTLRRVASGVVTLTMLVGAVGGGLYTLIKTGRIDAGAVGLNALAPRDQRPENGGYESVYPASMRSLMYPTRMGTSLLVFTGEVENLSDTVRGELDVLAQVVDKNGQVTASNRSPVGVLLDVNELAEVVDRRVLERIVSQKVQNGMASPLTPGETRRFMVVLPSPPKEVDRLRHTVAIVPSMYRAVPAPSPPRQLDERTGQLDPVPTENPKKKRRRNRRAKRAARAE